MSKANTPRTLWKAGNYFHNVPVSLFNRLCLLLAALWLALSVPVGILWRPTMTDLGQFYIGGALVSEQNWNALYPVPVRGSHDNAGLNGHSIAKPAWKIMTAKRNVRDYTHFILPPPSALLFVPLSWLDHNQAFWIWMALSAMCVWAVALMSARFLRIILRQDSRYEGLLVLAVAFSPMTARAIRIGNVTPFAALSICFILLSLIQRRHSAGGALALVVGAMLKYATLIFLPLIVVMRRWKLLAFSILLGGAILALTIALAGIRPFLEFYQVILPTLSRPSGYAGNQSLAGFLARIFGRPFPWKVVLIYESARLFTLQMMLILLAGTRKSQYRNPVRVMSAAAMILSWLLIFSPIVWEHSYLFICPVWGWLLWEGRAPGIRRIVAACSLVLMFFPAGIIQVDGIAAYPVTFSEPFNSTQLLSMFLVFFLACTRMQKRWQLSRQPTPQHLTSKMSHLDKVEHQTRV